MSINTYKLTNKNGMVVTVTNLGCAIITLEVPGKDGKLYDVVLGLDKAEDYGTAQHPFFGVVAGRVANRIAKGAFTLSGKNYQLETNDGPHHLHGGIEGFDKKVWSVDEVTGNKIVFTYNSPDGDAKYPGNLNARVTYNLDDNNALRMDYYATTDTETICNLTNHSYFNLNGHDDQNIFDHELEIVSDKMTAVDEGLIPTGEYMDVIGTPFDFRTPKTIGQDIEAAGNANNTGGYDHNYVLREPGKAASVYAPKTGIRMTVFTNSPGMQLYTGNMMSPTQGKGVTYGRQSGFCLETQIYPDAINHPNFPSCIVTKEKPQQFYTEFKFDW
ncbi:MAG: galactose mutarotase [Firmicutes bacterium]|nr:galactose mutarotase [Bacillota bacterium]